MINLTEIGRRALPLFSLNQGRIRLGTPKQYDALTTLRGFAAWIVVCFHFVNYMPRDISGVTVATILSKGALAVDFFFILSGFVINLNYSQAFSIGNQGKPVRFILYRLARVYPLHIFILAAYVIVQFAFYFHSGAPIFSHDMPLSYLIMSVFLIQNWGFASHLSWNVPAWSISTELFCYLLYPWIAKLFNRVATNGRRVVLALVATLSCLAAIFSLSHLHTLADNILQFGLVRCFLEFVVGMLLQKWVQMKGEPSQKSQVLILALGGLVTSICFYLGAPDYLFIPAFFTLIILSFTNNGSLISKILSNRFLVYVGTISYSTYLCHYLLKIIVLLTVKDQNTVNWIPFAAYCISVAGASIVLYPTIEVQSRKWAIEKINKLGIH